MEMVILIAKCVGALALFAVCILLMIPITVMGHWSVWFASRPARFIITLCFFHAAFVVLTLLHVPFYDLEAKEIIGPLVLLAAIFAIYFSQKFPIPGGAEGRQAEALMIRPGKSPVTGEEDVAQ